MSFTHTRGLEEGALDKLSFTDVIVSPIASFGGLFAPANIPALDEKQLLELSSKSYLDLTKEIFSHLSIEIDADILQKSLQMYSTFDNKKPLEIKQLEQDLWVCELWHGPTRAFKDMALAPFGELFSSLAKKDNKKYLILTATSGDTGPAALEAFANKENIVVVCLYPNGATSDVQRLQMVTKDAKNLKIIGVKGNFDDTQKALKCLLADKKFKEKLALKELNLSAANSVNFGRIAFQIVYYFYSYFHLVNTKAIKMGDKIDFIVPSGNFGNALGAFYAKKMGLFVEKIVIASNENNILTELFTTGCYDLRNKTLIPTISPAMDILRSSNVERLLFHEFGSKRTKELMQNLETKKHYKLSEKELEVLQENFSAFYSSQNQTIDAIKRFGNKDYLLDPHTATCFNYTPKRPSVVMSTAQWTKFSLSVIDAIMQNSASKDEDALKILSKRFKSPVPKAILDIFSKEIIHSDVVNKEEIKEAVENFIDSF